LIVLAWNRSCLRRELEAERTETARLQNSIGKKSESIWSMKKAELQELARKELGMTRAQSDKETVTTLRERIRSQRKVQEVVENPLSTLPKGLDGMLKAALEAECQLRDLPLPTEKERTRAKMIVLIRDDVSRRQIMPEPRPPSSLDADWEMTDPTNQRRRT